MNNNNVPTVYLQSEYSVDKYLLTDFIELSINDIDKYYNYNLYWTPPSAFEIEGRRKDIITEFYHTGVLFKTKKTTKVKRILNCSSYPSKYFIHYKHHINKLPQELLNEIRLNPRVLFTLKNIENIMSDKTKEYWKDRIYEK